MKGAPSAFRAVRSIVVDYNPAADCQECDWRHVESPTTLPAAKAHVETTGHEVLVDRVNRSIYSGVAR